MCDATEDATKTNAGNQKIYTVLLKTYNLQLKKTITY